MIKGFFRNGCPFIKILVEGVNIEAMIDTGFNGYLMLSQRLIDELDLEQIGFSDYTTASGERKQTKIYKAIVELLNRKIEVSVISTDIDISLAGMDLFDKFRIVVEKGKNNVEIGLIK